MIVFKQTENTIYYYTDTSDDCIDALWERLENLSDEEFRRAQFKVFHYPDTKIEDYLKRTPMVKRYD